MSKIANMSASLVQKFGLSATEAQNFTHLFFEVMKDGIVNDHHVKVKGLGTFKLVEVNARESVDVNTGARIMIDSRYKLTFTPENAVRDQINSPFAQFESFELAGNADFTAIDEKYEVTEEAQTADNHPEEEPVDIDIAAEPKPEPQPAAEPIAFEEPVMEATTVEEEPVEESAPAPVAEHVIEQTPVETPKEEPVEAPKTEPAEAPKSEPIVSPKAPVAQIETVNPSKENNDSSEEIAELEEQLAKVKSQHCWLIGIIAALMLMLVGIGAFFWMYMRDQKTLMEELLAQNNTGTLVTDSVEAVPADTIVEPVAAPADTIKQQPVAEPKPVEAMSEYDKDARIRLGAYAIIGIDTTVVVQQGQTFASISKAYLGQGMECYVEAVNGWKKEAKPGDRLNIPKIILKKRLKKQS